MHISVYPNPTKTNISIYTESNIGKSYYINDMSGKLILSGKITSSEFELNTELLNTGVYVLSIAFENEIVHEKVVVE